MAWSACFAFSAFDWNFLGYVLRRGYAFDCTTILGQTGFFVLLSYLKLTERMYIYVFGAYLTVFFIGFTYYTTFLHVPGLDIKRWHFAIFFNSGIP